MEFGEIMALILGAGAGIGGMVIFAWLRGRRKASSGVSAGAVDRAKVAHESVDDALRTLITGVEGDREADHRAADERWKE